MNFTSNEGSGKLSKWYKIGIATLVCLVVSPIIFMVVKGLIGLILAAAAGLIAINLAPWFSIKLETLTLKLIGQDATDNPVETRMSVQRQTEEGLTKFAQSITDFAGNLKTFKEQVDGIVKKYPGKTASYIEQVATMEQLLEVRKNGFRAAKAALEEYKQETIEISDLWDMAKAAQKMGKSFGILRKDDPMKEFRTRTANKSVQNKMNNAMAELETALMEESNTNSHFAKLTQSDPNYITVDLKETANVVSNNR